MFPEAMGCIGQPPHPGRAHKHTTHVDVTSDKQGPMGLTAFQEIGSGVCGLVPLPLAKVRSPTFVTSDQQSFGALLLGSVL